MVSSISDKSFNNKNKPKQFKSKSNKRKENVGVVVRKHEFNKPDIKRRDYKINKYARDCFDKYFHTFQFICLYDIEMTNGDLVNGMNSDKKFKQIVRENGFILKLTRKSYSSLSNK